MRVAGSGSWRVDVSDASLCRLALFVRDAAGLEISGPDAGVPPLVGPVPELSSVLDADGRRAAGDQWPGWWRQIVDSELLPAIDDQDDARTRARRRIAAHQAVCDPPDFESLADRSALRAAARAGYERFTEWESTRPSMPRDGLSGSPLDWSLMKQTAEDVAFDHRVSIEVVQARVAVLPVQGVWWRRVAPGSILCSPDAAADPTTSHVLLRDAFVSQIVGQV